MEILKQNSIKNKFRLFTQQNAVKLVKTESLHIAKISVSDRFPSRQVDLKIFLWISLLEFLVINRFYLHRFYCIK